MPIQHIFATVAASTNFVSPWIPLDVHNESGPNVGWAINKATTGGAIRAVTQGTLDEIEQVGVSAVGFTLGVFSADAAESTVAQTTIPLRAIRVSVSASASSGLSFRVLQVCP